MSAPQLEWHELRAPADDFDEPALSLIARYVETANRVARDRWSDGSQDTTVEEIVAALRHPDDDIALRHLVTADGADVGRGVVSMSREAGAAVAYVSAWVVPEARGRGIGRAIAERLERQAARLGATSLQGWADHGEPVPGEPVLRSASGHGAIAVDAAARLLTALGWSLEQMDRISALELAGVEPSLETMLADVSARAGEAYAVRSWQGSTPAELAPGLAVLRERMATDAPFAGLEVDEERWDAARIARKEAELTEAGQTILQAIAIHRPSGAPVAYTILLLPTEERPAFQEDTLVHAEHRGHRLGMLVKAENLLQLRRLHPRVPRVLTWNAVENAPMLRVNEALGFAPIGVEGTWQKRLSAAGGATPR